MSKLGFATRNSKNGEYLVPRARITRQTVNVTIYINRVPRAVECLVVFICKKMYRLATDTASLLM